MRTTYMAKKNEVERNWVLIDAENVPLGRVSAVVASILRGKNKPTYTPHVDTGDFVVVINADKITLSGNKWQDKMYHHHTGYVGGIKSRNAASVMEKHPTRMLELAVKGMIPDTRLGRKQLTKLHVYAGSEHNHQAQQPKELDINTLI